ncbi:DUF6768 family protein [Maricaulis sp.]|uniref:DUF6768 family protein n=1 Tax=Maricaulis sp. TaxID=1486257 RepID=UPI0026243801|nr:DUF6768 family protein [Maricaulis sp.]
MSNADKDLDELISEALDDEDRKLLGRYAEPPGFFAQVFSIFSGSLGWVMAIVMIMVPIFFGLFVWTGWNFFQQADVIMALRWGLGSLASLQIILFLRGILLQQVMTNQVLREVKRMELQMLKYQHRE